MFVDLKGKSCLVVGGGAVAERKAKVLLSFGAEVTVVATEIKGSFQGCKTVKKGFEEGDTEGVFIAVAATNDSNLNERIAGLCKKKGIHINRADDGKEGSFVFGAAIKRDSLVIAVNSGESCPLRSKRIKENLEAIMDKNVIKIGTRKSRLAKIQTNIVTELLKKADNNIICDIIEFSTSGDKNLDKSLTEFGGKGAFTGELEKALSEGKIDIAVHSAKDLPVEIGEGLEISATPERERANDVIVTLKGRVLDESSLLGTSSLRRSLQVPCKTADIRGNVETRLKKMEKGQFDGVILAYAGLKRLGLEALDKYGYKIMDTEDFVPAPCQGIIAVKGRKDSRFRELLKKINDEDTYYSFLAERGVVTRLGMGCHFPIGVYSEIDSEGVLTLRGTYLGKNKKSVVISDRKEKAEEAAAKMAEELKKLTEGEI